MPRDLTTYETSKFLDTPGTYNCTITKSEDSKTKNDDDCTSVTFETTEGKLISTMYVEKVTWLLAKLARACGLTDGQIMKFEPEMLIGKQCTIVVEQNPKTGNVSVSRTLPLQGEQQAQPIRKPSSDVPF